MKGFLDIFIKYYTSRHAICDGINNKERNVFYGRKETIKKKAESWNRI